MFPEANIEVEGKQNWLFPVGPVIKCFVIHPNWKIKKTAKKSFALCRLAHKFAAVSKSRSRKSMLFFPQEVSEFWPTIRDTFSSNRKTYLSWEVYQWHLIGSIKAKHQSISVTRWRLPTISFPEWTKTDKWKRLGSCSNYNKPKLKRENSNWKNTQTRTRMV